MDAGDSFLLKLLDSGTSAWVTKYSLVSIPPLRPHLPDAARAQQRNRDLFVLAMVGASVVAIAICYTADVKIESPWYVHALCAFALYRAGDVFVTLVRTGVFFSFRGDVQINKEPVWRLQRVLLGVMMNYVELILWFSVVYLQLAATSACQFNTEIRRVHQALNLSFTTMTTIGYGVYAPNSLLSTVIALWQAIAGVALLAIVVGVLIALLTRDQAAVTPVSPLESPSWLRPMATFAVVYATLYWLTGLAYC
jgi:hypothetical protein